MSTPENIDKTNQKKKRKNRNTHSVLCNTANIHQVHPVNYTREQNKGREECAKCAHIRPALVGLLIYKGTK